MKRPLIESLDEEDNVLVEELVEEKKVTKKERKGYLNCERATKNGMRCLNLSKNNFKIGPDCFQFCRDHVAEALARLIDLLFGKLYFLQLDMNDRLVRKDCHYSVYVTLRDEYDQETAHIYKTLGNKFALRGNTAMMLAANSSELVDLLIREGFVAKKVALQIEVASISESSGGKIKKFLVAVSNHQEIKIPTDDYYLNNEDLLRPAMVVQFEILIDGFEDLTK